MGNTWDSVKGMVTDGVTEKAVIYVPNPAANFKDLDSVITATGQLHSKLVQKAKKGLSLDSITKNVTDQAAAAVDKSDDGEGPVGEVAEENGSFIKVKVQYNPATIRLSTVNGRIQKRNTDEGVDRLNIYKFSGKSKLSFDLVFDDVDNANAFMLENLTPNVGNVVAKSSDMMSHEKHFHSVRKRMDAMMSLLYGDNSRQVIFFWAKMVFRGTLTNVQNTFTMFNPQGNPIRGVMHLDLVQEKGNAKLSFQEQYWEEAFANAFKKNNTLGGQSTLSALTNNNILNI